MAKFSIGFEDSIHNLQLYCAYLHIMEHLPLSMPSLQQGQVQDLDTYLGPIEH